MWARLDDRRVIWLLDLDMIDQRLSRYLSDRPGNLNVTYFRHIFIRSCGVCVYCHSESGPFHVDHITPIDRGGPLADLTNLALACQHCNVSKGYRTAEEFGYPTLQRFPPVTSLIDYEAHRRATHKRYPSSHRRRHRSRA